MTLVESTASLLHSLDFKNAAAPCDDARHRTISASVLAPNSRSHIVASAATGPPLLSELTGRSRRLLRRDSASEVAPGSRKTRSELPRGPFSHDGQAPPTSRRPDVRAVRSSRPRRRAYSLGSPPKEHVPAALTSHSGRRAPEAPKRERRTRRGCYAAGRFGGRSRSEPLTLR